MWPEDAFPESQTNAPTCQLTASPELNYSSVQHFLALKWDNKPLRHRPVERL